MAKENIAFFPKPCYTDTVKNIFRLLLQMPHISCAPRGILTAAITTGEETVSMLELQNICYRVSAPDGEQDILKDISITIPDHKLMVFTGPNGGGKTTLAKVVMGLVQPTSGRILYNGEDITGLSITDRARRGISYGYYCCYGRTNNSRSCTTAAIFTSVVENTSYRGPTRNQSVYVMRDKTTGDVQYVGRTNNPIRRQSEHAKDPKKANLQPLEVKFSGLTKFEARAMEQALISAYLLDNLVNARREIATENVGGFAGKIGNIISIFDGAVEDELLNLMER